jgi:ParB-like nuclease domain
MSNDETKLYNEDGAVAEAGADGVQAGLDARGVGIRMAHATLSYVSLSSIEPNPFRDLNTYPYDKRKLEALERSIEHVGLWEGLIGRRAGHGYELAFGHHRLEAARSRKLTTVPLIIRDLTDEEMVGFMGRVGQDGALARPWRLVGPPQFQRQPCLRRIPHRYAQAPGGRAARVPGLPGTPAPGQGQGGIRSVHGGTAQSAAGAGFSAGLSRAAPEIQGRPGYPRGRPFAGATTSTRWRDRAGRRALRCR